MNYFVEALLRIQPATWIAIASLSVSVAALIISNQRLSFDTRLIGAKKATEIQLLLFDFRRKIEGYIGALESWEKYCRDCTHYSEHNFVHDLKTADSFRKFANEYILALNSPVTKETAILLESITAYCDDLCKGMDTATELCRKITGNCDCRTEKKTISEQGTALDAHETAPR